MNSSFITSRLIEVDANAILHVLDTGGMLLCVQDIRFDLINKVFIHHIIRSIAYNMLVQ